MLAALLALAVAPWCHPLAFQPLPGWHTGMSGNTHSLYGGAPGGGAATPLESSAWAARGVRYRDTATADPPNRTLAHLPANGVVVWAVIFGPAQSGREPIRLDLGKATRFACCEAATVVGGEYELAGSGPGHAYSAIVRVYFGSRPTPRLRAEAQHALRRLPLPSPG